MAQRIETPTTGRTARECCTVSAASLLLSQVFECLPSKYTICMAQRIILLIVVRSEVLVHFKNSKFKFIICYFLCRGWLSHIFFIEAYPPPPSRSSFHVFYLSRLPISKKAAVAAEVEQRAGEKVKMRGKTGSKVSSVEVDIVPSPSIFLSTP